MKTSDRPPTRYADDAAGRLPAQVSSFIGRSRELDDVETLVGHNRLVTLTGPGGSGKTRLAIAVAARLNDAGLAVDFVELAPITDDDLAVGAIAAALGVREAPDESLLDALIRRAQNGESVLLLDNLEQIAGIGKLVAELLSRSPGLRVLATSRSGGSSRRRPPSPARLASRRSRQSRPTPRVSSRRRKSRLASRSS